MVFNRGFNFSGSGEELVLLEARWRRRTGIPPGRCGYCCHPEGWVLDYSFSMEHSCRVNGSPFLKRPTGCLHLYRPGIHYVERASGGDGEDGYFIFKGNSGVLMHLTDNPYCFIQISDPRAIIGNIIREGALAAQGQRGYWKSCQCFYRVMDILSTLQPDDDCPWQSSINKELQEIPLARKIREFLEKHYQQKLTIAELSAKFNCSESTISHHFQSLYGESIFDALRKIRITQSIPLLFSGHTLKEIAAETGFANEFYFSRVFRAVTGTSPRQYRERSDTGEPLINQ